MGDKLRVALSPGHYADDPGAINEVIGIFEHSVAFRIWYMTKQLLSFVDNIELVMINPKKLSEKIKQINEKEVDLAVEIHLDSWKDKGVTGTSVLYYPGSVVGKICADIFCRYIVAEIDSRNRGIYPRNDLAFLWGTRVPAVITESEFISNDRIARQLKTGFLTELIAIGHAKAIYALLGHKELAKKWLNRSEE